MSTESNKRKDAPDTADLPVCKKFCSDNADIVLKSTKSDMDPDTGFNGQPATLFRVNSEDLKRMSVVFRDMLTLGNNAQPGKGSVIDLPEDAWVLENLLLLNSTDIDDTLNLLRVHEAAAKHAMASTQVLLESEIRHKLPMVVPVHAARIYSHAKRHNRLKLATAAEKRLLQYPYKYWQLQSSDAGITGAFVEPLLGKLDQTKDDVLRLYLDAHERRRSGKHAIPEDFCEALEKLYNKT